MSDSGPTVSANQICTAAHDDIEAILRTHELFVSNKAGGRRAKLVSCDLANIDLAGRNLSEADFTGSVLYGANLRFANFQRANLYCTDLRSINGRCGNFSHADMRGASLGRSNLSNAVLDHADFRPARLAQHGLWGIAGIIDRNGSAAGTDFSFCSLCGTSFEGANLKDANFNGAVINAAKFKGARLINATFDDAVLTDIDLGELDVPLSTFKNCVLPSSQEAIAAAPHLIAKLQAHHRWSETNGRRGSSANLDDADLRPLKTFISRFTLTAISARRANGAGLDFASMEMQGANLEGADLRGANFSGADLRGAIFRGARLDHAKFVAADMRTLHLRSGELRPCDFTNANLSPEQIADAVLD